MSQESAQRRAQNDMKNSVNPSAPKDLSSKDKMAYEAEVKRQQELRQKGNKP